MAIDYETASQIVSAGPSSIEGLEVRLAEAEARLTSVDEVRQLRHQLARAKLEAGRVPQSESSPVTSAARPVRKREGPMPTAPGAMRTIVTTTGVERVPADEGDS